MEMGLIWRTISIPAGLIQAGKQLQFNAHTHVYIIATNTCRHANTSTQEHTHNAVQHHSIGLLLLVLINCIIWTANLRVSAITTRLINEQAPLTRAMTSLLHCEDWLPARGLRYVVWMCSGTSITKYYTVTSCKRISCHKLFCHCGNAFVKYWVAIVLRMCVDVANAKCIEFMQNFHITEMNYLVDLVSWQIWCTKNNVLFHVKYL